MAKTAGPRTVQCYLCGHRLAVNTDVLSMVCPACNRSITLENFVLKGNRPKLVMVTKFQTCGKVVVPKGARLVADLVEAHGGIEVEGSLEARSVISLELVSIGRKAFWRGDLKAPALRVESDAVIETGFFEVSQDIFESNGGNGHEAGA